VSTMKKKNMKRHLEARGPILVITLEGTFANDAPDFNKGIQVSEPLLHPDQFQQFERVVFDFSGVNQMTSSGMGILVVLMKMAKEAGHEELVAIASASDRIENALSIAHLSSMFEHFDDITHVPGVKQQ